LIKALTAKTVPLRSAASPPSSSAELPVTTPLPTKHGFKPASGGVPPPSVVKALTKKLGHSVLPDPAQIPSATPGSPVEDETTKIPPPTKTKAAQKPEPEELIPVESIDEPSAPAAPRRILPG
jgi:hypothetical protein